MFGGVSDHSWRPNRECFEIRRKDRPRHGITRTAFQETVRASIAKSLERNFFVPATAARQNANGRGPGGQSPKAVSALAKAQLQSHLRDKIPGMAGPDERAATVPPAMAF